MAASPLDPLSAAYCSPSGPEVFSGIVHGNQIWVPDPFDVPLIHSEARGTFAKLLDRASTPNHPTTGKILLILGEGGSGKTHLMRSFRAAAHEDGDGYCGYLQLATETDHYARYVLSKLIDSLERPYKAGLRETGLRRLARCVLDVIDVVPAEERSRLCEDYLEPTEAAELVDRLAYLAVQMPQFLGIDINVIRALLFTLANDPRIHAVVIQWLRCEDLSRRDRDLVGDLVPRPQPEMPAKTIHTLGRIMYSVASSAFVLLVDEMESTYDRGEKDDPGAKLRSAINTLVEIADSVPNCIIVMGCIHQMFNLMKDRIPRTKLDRLLLDPDSMTLELFPSQAEIEAMVEQRLRALFEAAGVPPDPGNPVAPFTLADIAGLVGLRSRDILDNLRRHRERCMQDGWLPPEWSTAGPHAAAPLAPPSSWPQRWNDYLAAFPAQVPDEEPQLAELLANAIQVVHSELAGGQRFTATRDDRFVAVEALGFGDSVERFLVAVCNKSTRGGGLANQVKETADLAAGIPVVLVRSTEFPKDVKQVASKEIAKIMAPVGKGRRAVVADADWRALAAFRVFHASHHAKPGFAEWQRADQPLSGVTVLRTVLDLDGRVLAKPVAPAPALPKSAPPAPLPPKPAPISTVHGIVLGTTRSAVPASVELTTDELCRHAAFLGGSGSGKTTAALTIIEQVLLSGVPVVLLDRKGDLARYADPEAWSEVEPDAGRAARRQQFRERIETVLYTPGTDQGRPLRIPIAPETAGLTTAETEQMAQASAAALAQMMGYTQRSPDPKVVILQKAIEVLARSESTPVTVKGLQTLVSSMDESLTAEIDGYEEKYFKKLGQDLLTTAHIHRRVLEDGEPLIIDDLLGRSNAASARTRLSIINTQFLGDDNTVDFWVAQFLLCIDRWRAKSPSSMLQAVFFFDEADRYLPAVGKPATKAPMEGLLKRSRSSGVGIFLATQSPGDLDYKCREQVLTWLIGRIKEPVAIAKLKPMLERRPDAAEKLASQKAGEFYLVRESNVQPIQVDRNLLGTSQLPEDRILRVAFESMSAIERSGS